MISRHEVKCTLEDVLEEIFGEVQDEFDSDEVEDIVEVCENCYDVNPMMRRPERTDRSCLQKSYFSELDTNTLA